MVFRNLVLDFINMLRNASRFRADSLRKSHLGLARALTRLVGGKPSRSKSTSTNGNEIPHRISEMAALICLTLSLLVAVPQVQAQKSSVLEAGFFSKKLYPILEKANCRGCHVENGVAAATRLHFPSDSASAEEIETFGRSLGVLVDKGRPEGSLLMNKPTQRIEHTGGKLIVPGSDEEKILITWVNYLANSTGHAEVTAKTEMAGEIAPPVLMRRLTHSQYNNTVRDLLGDQTRPANHFPQEDFVNGFKNQAEVQTIPPLLAEAYSAAGEKLAHNAYRSGYLKKLVSCRKASSADSDCSAQFIRHFGLKAFRRPLTESESNQYSVLFTRELRRTGDDARAAQIVIEAMLQSPNFLFRVERGRNGAWKQYEIATRLSYFLWDTMPDDELFRSAAAGELATTDGIERAARRLLRDARAHEALDEFVSQWLRFDRLVNTYRDRRRYTEFSPELAIAMTEETKRLIASLVWGNRNFMEIFTADYSFLNSDLASLYGFSAPSEEFALVKFPPASDRAGILGQAAFLTLTSKPADTSPTARGLFVREQLLCQKVPNPPPGTNMNLTPPSESKPQTTRDRLSLHRANESCARCHNLIDSIGFGLEKFDAIGKRREKESIQFFPAHGDYDAKPKTVELDLDASGIVLGIPDSQFSSPKELGKLLAATSQCQSCIVKQLFRYALGRPETPADRSTLEQALETFRGSQFQFKELIISLVKSNPFRE